MVFLAGSACAEPRFYYGPDCPQENASAGQVPDSLDGIVLEGSSGQIFSRDIACADRPAAFRAFSQAFRGPVGNVYAWSKDRNRGTFRITWEFQDHGAICRDFAQDHVIRGQRYLRQGTACLEADGNWHLH